MKIDLITARGEVNKNGIKYNLSSFDDALKNYINDIPVKYVEFVSDYDSIMSDIRRLTTVKMDEVVGTVESIYDDHIDFKPFEEYNNIDPSNYYAAFRFLGYTDKERNDEFVIKKIVAVDLINKI
jgi:hypothetical protein